MTLRLLAPEQALLPPYVAALRAGWSPSTTRDVTGEHLAAIERDSAVFLAELQGRAGGTIELPDGRMVPRLPGPTFWLWDGAFCGQINLRYQKDTLELPATVSGHVGYSVVPWKRRQGIATRALRMLLPIAAGRGLPRVLVTCDAENLGSRKVIEAADGVFSGTVDDEGVTKLLFWVATVHE